MDKLLFNKAKIMARMFKVGVLLGREAQDGTTSYEKGNFVQISIAVFKDKRFGKKGVYRYDVNRQTCFVFKKNDVVVIAPYGNRFHFFYCEYDKTIDGHLPIYFLCSYRA